MSIISMDVYLAELPMSYMLLMGVGAIILFALFGIFSEIARSRRTRKMTATMGANQSDMPVPVTQTNTAPSFQPNALATAAVTSAVAAAATGNSSGNAHPSGVGRAWSDMPGGWQALRAIAIAPDLPIHGFFPISDGIERTDAGIMVGAATDASWPGLPGGWATLARGGAVAAAASVSAIAAVAAPVVASSPAPVAPIASAPQGSGNASWATMPGGWQSMLAIGVAANHQNHGNVPLHDGIARTGAGIMVAPTAAASWPGLPGGWATLARGGSPVAVSSVAPAVAAVVAATGATMLHSSTNGGAAPGAASGVQDTLKLAWANMPGGWQKLSSTHGVTASELVARRFIRETNHVPAGAIIGQNNDNVSAFPSWASMPGGWASLKAR